MTIKTPNPIQPLPLAPNPADRSTFNTRAYPWSAALDPWTNEANKLAADTHENAQHAHEKAGEAAQSALDAQQAEVVATGAAGTATSAAGVAVSARDAAQQAGQTASSASVAAVLARDKAQQWATSTSTVESGMKGARGYAQDAAQSAQEAADVVTGSIGAAIHAAAAKTTPVDNDELAIVDSAASWGLKKLKWSALKDAVWAAFKTIATGATAKDKLGLGTAATMDVTTSHMDTTAGRVLKVGDGGWMGRAEYNGYPAGYPSTFEDSYTTVYRRDGVDNGVSSYASSFRFAAMDTWGAIRVDYNFPKAWMQGGHSSTGSGWTSQVVLSDNLHTETGQDTSMPMSQKAVTDALENIDVSGPRPVKDHGDVATAGSQTVVCNVQESDFHIMSMVDANSTGTLTINFANIPDTVGKHFSWHVRIKRGGRKSVAFTQTIEWSGGVAPSYGNLTTSWDTLMFYKVGSEPIRGMVIDVK